jgi:hypothetical protein
MQGPTVGGDALDRGNYSPLNARTSISAQVISTYENLKRAKHAQHYACFVYVIHVLGYNVRSV